MANPRITFDWYPKEVEKQLLRDKPTQKLVDDTAGGIADSAALMSPREGRYDVRGYQGYTRYRAHVGTANWGARWDERKDRILTRATFGSRI